MDAPTLPRAATQMIEYLAFLARGFDGRLQRRAFQRFKASLVASPAQWTHDLVPIHDFERRCLVAGLSEADTAELITLLRRLHRDRQLRVSSSLDRVSPIDVPDDWTPPDRDDSESA